MTTDPPANRGPRAETDPRFPSGPWKGFWLQPSIPGRQWMHAALAFAGGRVTGEGRDVVGKFTVAGTYDLKTGRCTLFKQYVGAHQVVYDGFNDGVRLWLWGTWKLAGETGGFHLWPAAEADPTGDRLKEAKVEPADAEQLLPV